MVNCPLREPASASSALSQISKLVVSPVDDVPAAIAQPTLGFDRVRHTVIKTSEETGLPALMQLPSVPEAAIAAMQQLVDLIGKLRSPQSGWQPNSRLSSDELVPYASDEAYDVLEALSSSSVHSSPVYPALLLIDDLIPRLLWNIARQSYPVMQLLEGVQACACRPPQRWVPGILRLVVLLDVQTPTGQGCFDLVANSPAPTLLDQDWWVHPDLNGFAENPDAERQLQHITCELLATQPVLAQFHAGIETEMLVPEADWQSGQLHLRFGFEFLPCPEDAVRASVPADSLWIEAELLEELEPESGLPSQVAAIPSTSRPLSMRAVDLPLDPPALSAEATILRLAEGETLTAYRQLALHREIARALSQFHHGHWAEDELVRSLIQAADRLNEAPNATVALNFCLVQPELLMDEVVPKVLWQLTRSSYEVMQLLGGVAAQGLEPGLGWQTGQLRLVALLELAGEGLNGTIDVVAGQFVKEDVGRSLPVAIIQSAASPFCQTAISTETLLAQITQQLQTVAPELGILLDGTEIEQLTIEQDWQPATLKLRLGVELCPDFF